MKALMTTDGSAETLMALRTASRLLRKKDCEATVLCVAPEFYPPKGETTGKRHKVLQEEYRRRVQQETKQIAKKTQAALREEGIESEAITEFGSPAEVIIRLSDGYDVVVVGATGRREHSSYGLGPVASRVVQQASGTILAVRGEFSANRLRILVGVDGSRASQRAIESLIANFNLDEAEITLMHVKETPWIHVGLQREWFAYPEDAGNADVARNWNQDLHVEANELIEEARDQFANLPITVVTNVGEGNPGTEMLGEADSVDYDLIIVGATGVSDVKHNLLGSVSTKIAWYAPCSVAVVRKS